MNTNTLIEVRCRGCESSFYVHPAQNAAHPDADLCHSCRCFKAAMEHMMRERVWEKDKTHRFSPALKGFGIGLLLMSTLLGACWAIVNWLR